MAKISLAKTPQQVEQDLIVEDFEDDDDAWQIARKSPEKAKSSVGDQKKMPESPRFGRQRRRSHEAKRHLSATTVQDDVITTWKIESKIEEIKQRAARPCASRKVIPTKPEIASKKLELKKLEKAMEFLFVEDVKQDKAEVAVEEVEHDKTSSPGNGGEMIASHIIQVKSKDDIVLETTINTEDYKPTSPEDLLSYNEKMLSRYRGVYGKVSPSDLIPVMAGGCQVQIGHGKHGILKLCRFFGKLVVEKTLLSDEGK